MPRRCSSAACCDCSRGGAPTPSLVHPQGIGTGLPGGPGYEVPERLVLMQRHLTRDRVEVLVVDPQECGQEDVIHRHRQPELERGVSPRWRWNELKA